MPLTALRRRPGPAQRAGVVLLASALVATAVACGGSSTAEGDARVERATEHPADPANCPVDALDRADGPVEVTVWHGLVGQAQEALEALAAEYNASQQRVRVSVDAQGDYEELFAKVTASLLGPSERTLPDILLAQDTDTRFLVDSGAVIAASDCIAADPDAEEQYDRLADFVRAGYTVDGLLWPAAFGVATPVLYYNRSHLEQAGLDPDDPPADLDELRTVATAIKAVRPEGRPLVFRAHSWWIEHLATRLGEAFVDQDNGRAGLSRRSRLANDTVTEVIEWMAGMVRDGLMTVFYRSQESEAPLSMIRPGPDSSSMLIDTSSAVTTLDALLAGKVGAADIGLGEAGKDDSLDMGVGTLPGLRSSGSGQVAGNAWYLVDAPDLEVAGAWDFVRWVNEIPQQVKWAMKGSYLPAWQGVAEHPELQRYFTESRPGRWLAVAHGSLDSIDPEFPGPLVGPYAELRETLRVALERVLIEGRPLQEELARADASFQAALDAYASDLDGD